MEGFPWHDGERSIQRRVGVDDREDNPTIPFLPAMFASRLPNYPLMAVGTLDDQDRPWVTLWGTGAPPLSQSIAQNVIAIKSEVDASFDPVVEAIWKGQDDGEIVRQEGDGKLFSALGIHLELRSRLKLAGKIIAGALNADSDNEGESKPVEKKSGKSGNIQLAVSITQSLPNCPKYLNKKIITSSTPKPKLLSNSAHLSQEALDLIKNADTMFVTSAHEHEDMDANIRGGPQGFIRVAQPESTTENSTIIWPEYSGNNLYQTLGNLERTPKAGLVIPNFETGDVLYVTGTTEVLVGKQASSQISKSNLAVRLRVTAARLVQNGLPFRGKFLDDPTKGRSPYNPRVRALTSEKPDEFGRTPGDEIPVTAQLVKKTKLTPTITRYRFALADPAILGPWKPGQYVAMDFSSELYMGYSHMRDDDPTSLNDDFTRTFTVSSIPNSLGVHGEEFEITVRKVGSVTRWLEWQKPGSAEIGIRGFGGEFIFDQQENKRTGFIAAGIGITPLLGQLGNLDTKRVDTLWSLGIRDVGLAVDLLKHHPELKEAMTIFLTGDEKLLSNEKEKHKLEALRETGVTVHRRRLAKEDLLATDENVDNWYLCTAAAMRKEIQQWLPGKSFTFENFDY